MAVAGAIFDCDGTLIDSMPLWNQVFRDLVSAHGAYLSDEVFDEGEPLSADEECIWLHERFGIGESAEQLTAELRALIREAYATRIEAWPGVKGFLDELRAAGIPMVIATSTPADDVAVALQAQGLSDYFSDIIFAGDVGRSKEYSDVYFAACERLGSTVGDTWVFEDAPFGLATARAAGFRTVCLLNDHDGRDEAFCHEHSDILAYGYQELSLARLRDFEAEPTHTEGCLRCLIVAGSPERSSSALIAHLADENDYVIAADAGVDVCRGAAVTPHAWVGDADSALSSARTWARAHVPTIIDYPKEKNATDLKLAFDCARHEAARRRQKLELTLTCASRGRMDHALGVLGLLLAHSELSSRIVEDGVECRLLSPDANPCWELGVDAVGATFSAVPLVGSATVSERGLQWELDRFTLAPLDDRGISNIVSSDDARVICHAGVLACFLQKESN